MSESDRAERSRSSDGDSTTSKRGKMSTFKKLRNVSKKKRQEIEELKKRNDALESQNVSLHSQLKEAIDELRSYRVIVEASLNAPKHMDLDSSPPNEDMQPKRKRTDDLDTINYPENQQRQSLTATIRKQQQELQQLQEQAQEVGDNAEQHEPSQQTQDYNFPPLEKVSHNPFKRIVHRPAPSTSAGPANSSRFNQVNNDNQTDKTQRSRLTGSDADNQQKATQSSGRTPPPIVVYDIDTKKAAAAFSELLGHSNFDINNKNTRCSHICTRNRKDYDVVAKAICEMRIEHHRYTPVEDKIINVVLRHLCPTYSLQDVEEGIQKLELDIELHNVQKYETEASKREDRDLNLWLIQLKPGSDVSALLRQRRFLCQSNIVFERRKTSGVLQCKNCQHFKHSANNCARQFRCVKCVDAHAPGQCPTDNMPAENRRLPTCVNCNSNHPANYRGCPKYTEILKQKQERIREQQEREHFRLENLRFRQQSFGTLRSNQLSYAAAAANRRGMEAPASAPSKNTASSNKEGNSFSFIQQECNSMFGMDLFAIQRHVRNFAPRYKQLQGIQKQEALIEFILTITPDF